MSLKLNTASGSVTLVPEDALGNTNITIPRSGYAAIADTAVTGDMTAENITMSGNLTVNGTTTTVSSTNTVVADGLMELANGTTGVPVNDTGIVIERGDSDNAFIGFDESEDKFVIGTGSFTGADTGDLTITTGTLLANIQGQVTVNGPLDIEEVKEKVTASTSTSGTIDFNLGDHAIVNFTADQTANRTINFRGDSSTTLNSIMETGQSMTTSIVMKQGTTAYYLNAYQIDGAAVTPKWSGGDAPSEGNASSLDVYSFTMIKTADATFTVLASQTQYA